MLNDIWQFIVFTTIGMAAFWGIKRLRVFKTRTVKDGRYYAMRLAYNLLYVVEIVALYYVFTYAIAFSILAIAVLIIVAIPVFVLIAIFG